MKAIILSILIGIISYMFPSLSNAQTTIDSTKYVITLVNGNEYTGFIISDDGREILIETDNLGKIYIPKSDVSKMDKKVKIDSIRNDHFLSVISLVDGTEIIGKIMSDDGKEVVIETEKLGKIYVNKTEITEIKRKVNQEEIINGEYEAEGPFTTRYAFSNNALPIKKGENYAMVNLYGPEIHFAATNRLNIGVMSTWIGSPIALAVKYTFKTKESKVNYSIGSMTGTSGYMRNFGGFGSLNWASVTFGDRKNNFTFSGGYGFIRSGRTTYDYNTNKETKEKMNHGPAFSMAGIFRVGAKTSFILESVCFTYSKLIEGYSYTNWDYTTQQSYTTVVPDYKQQVTTLMIMPGMRFQKTAKKAFQISLAGVSVFRKSNNSSANYYYGRDRVNFPMPMLSWFYKI